MFIPILSTKSYNSSYIMPVIFKNIVQRFEVIFYQDNSKHRCNTGPMELFFEEVMMKKNEKIGLIYSYNWH